MIGCVVQLQAFGYAARLGRRKRFVERAGLVGVEIVQDQPDHCGLRICLVNQPLHLMREVHGSPAPGHLDVPPPTLRFTEHEQIPGPVSLVLSVIALHPSGGGLNGRPHIPEQLLGWTLRNSSGVSEGIDKPVVQSGRDFPYIRVGGGQ